MFNKFYLALLIFLAPLSISNAQQNVQELTLSIVDTTQSTYYQANQIYNCIITNIAFDVKSYKNLECLNYTVPEILKKRKGLCNEFALLFSTMCNSANIEAYCIAAYLKGPGYYSGKPFLRAEHAINVFMYDSVWHFVDPTLGSGYIFEDAKTYRKILHRAFKLPAAKQKLKFISEPDSAWFDIPVEMLLGKLYPLDPKWFVTDRPYSFESFEKDSLLERTEYPDYLNNILSIRGTSPENILKQEGVNGIRFNDHNYFDIANGYVTIASNYYLERNILRTNVDQFEKYNDEFQIAFDAIKKHMALNDSVYRARKTSLKALSQNHNKISKKIDSKAKSAQSSFRSGNRQTSGKSLSYRRKIESYLLKAEKTKIQIVPDSITRDSVKTDSKKVKDLYSEWLTFELSEPGLQHKTDSFFLLLDKQFIDDAKIDDSINFKNYLFADIILGLNSAIEINNEDSIRAYVDTLITIYYDIGDLLTRKKSTKKNNRSKIKRIL